MFKRPLFATALVASVCFSGHSSASVISSGVVDIAIPTNFAGVFLDLDGLTDGLSEFAGADANFFFGGEGISNDADDTVGVPTWQPVRTGTGNLDPVANLSFGTVINGLTNVYSSGYGGSGDPNDHIDGSNFSDGVEGYIGFSLDVGGSINYGWMRVTLMAGTAGGLIHEWAYEDAGFGIEAGGFVAVPEASQSAVLAIGALGIALHRRRRRKTA